LIFLWWEEDKIKTVQIKIRKEGIGRARDEDA
jgi:hypothetical protein